MSFFSNLAKKIYSKGSNFVGKVRSTVLHGAGKVRSVLTDVRNFVKEVNDVAPLATKIIDDVTNLIPGVAPLKKGLEYGLSAFNTIGSVAKAVDDKIEKSSAFARNPNVQRFNRIFDK